MTLGQNILDRLKELEKSQVWLCAEVDGLEIGTLNALVKRKSRNSVFAPAIAEKLGVSLDWLLTSKGRKDRSEIGPDPSQAQKNPKSAAINWPFKHFTASEFLSLTSIQQQAIDEWVAKAIAQYAPLTSDKKILPKTKMAGSR